MSELYRELGQLLRQARRAIVAGGGFYLDEVEAAVRIEYPGSMEDSEISVTFNVPLDCSEEAIDELDELDRHARRRPDTEKSESGK